MTSILSRILFKSPIYILATVLLAAAPQIGQASTSSQPVDKHARKIEKRLARFRPGAYLDFEFRDASETFGALGELSGTSFQFTDSDSNKIETRSYADLERVKPAKEFIGEGSQHRHVRLLVPALVTAGAAAAGIATYEVVR